MASNRFSFCVNYSNIRLYWSDDDDGGDENDKMHALKIASAILVGGATNY